MTSATSVKSPNQLEHPNFRDRTIPQSLNSSDDKDIQKTIPSRPRLIGGFLLGAIASALIPL
ncbi:MAG: hypothetical protein N4J56_006617 [Chroococcidiopsis sp. SAG 2025]|uniref:hypothetical protein n=1 Tax=Chroococcidiopsis sp. SAG 2025 TaxID=171389 RepID=UPI002936E423|nr:hypothetical protein [Chroococcidiopsis sp. SAG 2025]MDV2996912.1 hypothetical protein [Chroococcidiopsis sp. SAG 2025]